jgi:gliding motility-associated-like protein
MLKKVIIALIGFVLLSPLVSRTQIVVDSLSIEEYVQDVLLGSGIQATNITYTGCFAQIAYMHEGASVGLGIDGGVVLSTDYAKNIQVPSPGLGLWNLPNCPTTSGEPDLLNVANSVPGLIGQSFSVSSVNDVSILEFDFVPTGDTLRFNYIFGSMEYNAYENTTFNDIFSFFLSGPGITGPYDSPAAFPNGAVNIAQVPNSNPALPITISSVNGSLNQQFYINNPTFQAINVDGYTVVLEAMHEVTCGETYHIKLAIADGSDTALESIVILEEGSFSSNAVVDVDLSINVGGPDADVIYEDCGEATLTFTRAQVSNLALEDMVLITWNGDATMGVDYNAMPDTIIFPIGVSSITLNLDAFTDGLAEGQELVQMDILNLAACNGSGLVSNFEFFIGDVPEPLVVEGFTESICAGGSIDIAPIITGGFGNYIYDWSTGQTTEEITVSPLATTTYNIMVSDTCGMPSDDANIIVEVAAFDPLTLSISPDPVVVECFGTSITAIAAGGNGVYTNWMWEDASGTNLWGWENSLYMSSWNFTNEVTVSVEDGCGTVADYTFYPTSTNVPLTLVQETEIEALCGTTVIIDPQITGGTEPYFISWYDGNWNWLGSNPSYTFTAENPLTLNYNLSDNCGNFQSLLINVTITNLPIEATLPTSYNASCTDVTTIVPTIIGGNGNFTYVWEANGQIIGNDATLDFNTSQNTDVTFSISDDCGAFATATTTINIINEPPVISLSEDQSGTCIDVMTYTAEATGGAGGYVYTWSANGGDIANGNILEDSFDASTTITCTVEDVCGLTDEATVEFLLDIPLLTLTTIPDSSICFGSSITLFAETTGGAGAIAYEWTGTFGTTPTVVVEPGGNHEYTVTVSDQCGQVLSNDIEIEVQDVDATFASEYLSDVDVQFYAASNDSCADCTYNWSFGDGTYITEPDPAHTFDGLDQYAIALTVINELGCSRTEYSVVHPPVSIYIPNAFTPDGDGINDVWKVEANGVLTFEVFVFNRWGDLVWTSKDQNQAWTGGRSNGGEYFLEDGVYNYLIKYTGVDGDAQKRAGSLSLMR